MAITSRRDEMLNAIGQKLVDFDEKDINGNYIHAPKEGIVDIIPIKRQQHKEPNFQFKSYMINGVTYGIPTRINPEDDSYIFKTIRITGAMSFNLSNENERRDFIMIKNWQRCKNSPAQQGRAMVEVYDRNLEARDRITKFKLAKDARDIAEDLAFNEDRVNELFGFARLMGIEPNNETSDIIKERLLTFATEQPHKFLEKWQDKETRNILMTIKRGLSTGTIIQTMDKGYMFNSVVVGFNEVSMLNYFRTNTDSLTALDIESKDRDPKFVKSAGSTIETVKVDPEAVKEVEEVNDAEVLKYRAIAAKKGYRKDEWEGLSLTKLKSYISKKAVEM